MSLTSATLITGASSGLGAEFARACAARGDRVVLVARRRQLLEALADELGSCAHVVVADLTERNARRALPERMAALGFHVETLINNAGFGLVGRFATQPGDRQLAMIELNIAALTELSRLFLPEMIERKSGGILNVASTAAFQPGPGFAIYFATKAYVLSLTEALHQEVKGTGIKVSALCPGPTATGFGEVAGVHSQRFSPLTARARAVVEAGLKGLDRNRAVVVPGAVNKLTAQSSRVIPRALMRRIVAAIKI